MQIGAIGATPYTPYIYNTNTVSRASMNKIKGIGEDLLESKTDFSALSSQETTNPIKRGQSLDFAGIMSMQMEMSRMNAARVMKEPAEDEQATQAVGVVANDMAVSEDATAIAKVPQVSAEDASASAFDFAKAMSAYQPIDLYA